MFDAFIMYLIDQGLKDYFDFFLVRVRLFGYELYNFFIILMLAFLWLLKYKLDQDDSTMIATETR
jgi:hypothetical protein